MYGNLNYFMIYSNSIRPVLVYCLDLSDKMRYIAFTIRGRSVFSPLGGGGGILVVIHANLNYSPF